MGLVLSYDMGTLTPAGKMKNLAPTGPAYDGTINGTYTPSPPLIRAKKTACMLFDGVNNYISLANPISGLQNFSIIWWTNESVADGIIFSRAGAGGTYTQIVAGTVPLAFTVGGNRQQSRRSFPISNSYMFCVTHDSSNNGKQYFNGRFLETDVTVVGANPVDANAYIGQYWDGSLRYTGRIDNFLIYNTTLSPEQVWKIYRSSVPR